MPCYALLPLSRSISHSTSRTSSSIHNLFVLVFTRLPISSLPPPIYPVCIVERFKKYIYQGWFPRPHRTFKITLLAIFSSITIFSSNTLKNRLPGLRVYVPRFFFPFPHFAEWIQTSVCVTPTAAATTTRSSSSSSTMYYVLSSYVRLATKSGYG